MPTGLFNNDGSNSKDVDSMVLLSSLVLIKNPDESRRAYCRAEYHLLESQDSSLPITAVWFGVSSSDCLCAIINTTTSGDCCDV